jgi:hypothetical protein
VIGVVPLPTLFPSIHQYLYACGQLPSNGFDRNITVKKPWVAASRKNLEKSGLDTLPFQYQFIRIR